MGGRRISKGKRHHPIFAMIGREVGRLESLLTFQMAGPGISILMVHQSSPMAGHIFLVKGRGDMLSPRPQIFGRNKRGSKTQQRRYAGA